MSCTYGEHQSCFVGYHIFNFKLTDSSRPFQDAVHAGSGNIMCSYNRLNNSYGCANSKTLNGILKTELGFQVSNGLIVPLSCSS